MASQTPSSVELEDVARFSAQAEDFWNPKGAFRFLHKLEPLRLEYVRNQICSHLERDPDSLNAMRGIKVLDVGCGGGLMSEPLTRMGAEVTGLDASPEAIEVAQKHAKSAGLKIKYQTGSVEEMASGKTRFDVIIALEVIEHVKDVGSFLSSLAKLLKPNGLLVMSAINRTPRSFLLGIVAAEYILGWVPAGTHDWEKFIPPHELVKRLENLGITAIDLTGMVFSLFSGEFVLKKGDMKVNYLLTALKS